MTDGISGKKIFDQIFDELNLKTIVDTAVFQAVTGEAKNTLLSGVLEFMSTPTGGDRWGDNKKTPLQHAFETSLEKVVKRTLEETFEKDHEIAEEIKRCVNEAVNKFMAMDKSNLIEAMSYQIRNAMAYRINE